MRILTLFALSLLGTGVLANDALAFGKKRGNGCCGGGGCHGYSGCYGGGCHGGYSGCHGGCYGGCYGTYISGHGHASAGSTMSGYAIAPSSYGTWTGSYAASSGTATSGQPSVVQGTDGQTYTLGADGKYYGASSGGIVTLGGFTTQPYSGRSMISTAGFRGTTYYPSGVYPAGGIYIDSGLTPAGGLMTMPGVTITPRRR